MARQIRRWNALVAPALQAVSSRTGVLQVRIQERNNTKEVVQARRMVFTLLRRLDFSFPRIGELCGGYDHSSVLVAIRKCESIPEEAAAVSELLDEVSLDVEAAPEKTRRLTREDKRREELFRKNCARWLRICNNDISFQVRRAEMVTDRMVQEAHDVEM